MRLYTGEPEKNQETSESIQSGFMPGF